MYWHKTLKKSYFLEDLAELVIPLSGVLEGSILIQRTNQALVLEALIVLDSQGFIILDAATDKCFITIKRLININSS
ncbi:hypothetical protein FLACOL7796_04290 [Flavobacterium collinsii]|uniref:Uncharacterized protein n=2 Tax=Flavobacterium collinsii TaxID=1114861 RepID=A0ABN7EQ61_9FLAO|nr:hypothetical protein FLACOL7796_04290 [Flavobacterium collinsii]